MWSATCSPIGYSVASTRTSSLSHCWPVKTFRRLPYYWEAASEPLYNSARVGFLQNAPKANSSCCWMRWQIVLTRSLFLVYILLPHFSTNYSIPEVCFIESSSTSHKLFCCPISKLDSEVSKISFLASLADAPWEALTVSKIEKYTFWHWLWWHILKVWFVSLHESWNTSGLFICANKQNERCWIRLPLQRLSPMSWWLLLLYFMCIDLMF